MSASASRAEPLRSRHYRLEDNNQGSAIEDKPRGSRSSMCSIRISSHVCASAPASGNSSMQITHPYRGRHDAVKILTTGPLSGVRIEPALLAIVDDTASHIYASDEHADA